MQPLLWSAFASSAVYFFFDLAARHDPVFICDTGKIIEPVLAEEQRLALSLQREQDIF